MDDVVLEPVFPQAEPRPDITSGPYSAFRVDSAFIPSGTLESPPLPPSVSDACGSRLRNVPDGSYRVSWYETGAVHPSLRFLMWAHRRLRDIPDDWRNYYRRLLLQEVRSCRMMNTNWDVVTAVAEGYRRARWVLEKYGLTVKEGEIPWPYDDFWNQTTHEERVWAHRRSSHLKDLQGEQRDLDDLVFVAHRTSFSQASVPTTSDNHFSPDARASAGRPQAHAQDKLAPGETVSLESRFAQDTQSILMGSIVEDKMWNPVLRNRLKMQQMGKQGDLMGFEDEDDDDE